VKADYNDYSRVVKTIKYPYVRAASASASSLEVARAAAQRVVSAAAARLTYPANRVVQPHTGFNTALVGGGSGGNPYLGLQQTRPTVAEGCPQTTTVR
jgi:hypothetical protein